MSSMNSKDIENTINLAADFIKEKITDANVDVEQYSHEAGKKIGQIAADFNNKSEDYIQTGKTFIKEHPVQSLLIAGAVGIVVGSVLTMIFKKNKNS
jgi:ElaB/YqjD/DUF883 family membrane-anchored ribosome-binding protein